VNQLYLGGWVVRKSEQPGQLAGHSFEPFDHGCKISQCWITRVQMPGGKFEKVDSAGFKQIMASVGPLIGRCASYIGRLSARRIGSLEFAKQPDFQSWVSAFSGL
jgi:hypothetical protein